MVDPLSKLTINSILDIFSFARRYNVEVAISFEPSDNTYRIQLNRENYHMAQYISAEKLDVVKDDVAFAKSVLNFMAEKFKEVFPNEDC